MEQSDIDNRFNYHPPQTSEKVDAHQTVRTELLDIATDLNNLLPEGREKSTAITKLEEAMFWANAALARME
jgi:hypothetical protein